MSQPSPFPIGGLPLTRAFRSGYLVQNGADGLADVASHYATGPLPPVASRIDVVFGNAGTDWTIWLSLPLW